MNRTPRSVRNDKRASLLRRRSALPPLTHEARCSGDPEAQQPVFWNSFSGSLAQLHRLDTATGVSCEEIATAAPQQRAPPTGADARHKRSFHCKLPDIKVATSSGTTREGSPSAGSGERATSTWGNTAQRTSRQAQPSRTFCVAAACSPSSQRVQRRPATGLARAHATTATHRRVTVGDLVAACAKDYHASMRTCHQPTCTADMDIKFAQQGGTIRV
mmetsp:Transcript_20459/g.53513  ORF Transcript_20459/g.53513 Transcript_20459/m.53513 type:complete len:217 (+) Transcript_20459:165-815(+)